MAKDLGDLAAMMSRLPEELHRAELKGIRTAALMVTRGIRVEIRLASGGDSRLSGVGRSGARVGAKYDVIAGSSPSAVIRATGPLHLIERATRPHMITPRSVRGRGSKKKFTGNRALKFRDGTFSASAMHPGTRAKRPFELGYLKTRDEAGRQMDIAVQGAIRGVLK